MQIIEILPLIVFPVAGFPNWVRLVGGQFWQNGQKLHENYKIGIFGSKQWGDMEGQANFSGSGRGSPLSPPPPLEETLISGLV